MDKESENAITSLTHAVRELVHELAFHRSLSHLVTKQDLKELELKLMSAIQDFAAKQNAHNDAIDTAITGLTGDVKNLNDQIAALQASSGGITPEDQILLDQIEARSAAIADKLSALDSLTPPVVPTTP